MLSDLHTFRVTDGTAAFAPFTLPENPVTAAVLAELPTDPDGFYQSVEFVRPVPPDVLCEVRAVFHTDREPVEDGFIIDTRTREVRVYADNLRGLIYGAYALLQDARDSGDG